MVQTLLAVVGFKRAGFQNSPATHQTLRQQGGTGEDGHFHLAHWTLSVAATEKKNE